MLASPGFTPVPVHPHGRGDNGFLSVASPVLGGSPPRAWGQWPAGELDIRIGRFTPTGVGTIPVLRSARLMYAVHPHGRGDNFIGAGAAAQIEGSPPRAWGQLRRCSAKHEHARFTPTGVGTMPRRQSGTRMPPVHPHGRGDNARAITSAMSNPVHPHGRGDNAAPPERDAYAAGSPPRAWGQCAQVQQYWSQARFTPTGVGTMFVRG